LEMNFLSSQFSVLSFFCLKFKVGCSQFFKTLKAETLKLKL
jgi:hypothetical protein